MFNKSVRNLVVNKAAEYIKQGMSEDMLSEILETGRGSYTAVSADGNEVGFALTAAKPIIVINAIIPDFFSEDEDKYIECAGWAKQKTGDEWDPWLGFNNCVTRAARDYADQVLAELHTMRAEIKEEIKLLQETDRAICKIIFEGGDSPSDGFSGNVIATLLAMSNLSPGLRGLKEEEDPKVSLFV